MRLKNYKEYFERHFQEELSKFHSPEVIAEGMRYSCLQGGKRIRPCLLFMSLEVLGADVSLGIPFANALEMIHSYSLIHDDLPAMDNDDYRRGKLTSHKKFGESNAILIGDALLTNAFSVMIRGAQGRVPAEDLLEIVALYSEYSGIEGMIAGQTVDMESEGKQISLEELEYIHEHKTGKLLLLPIEVACILAKASEEERKALRSYGEKIGFAFQIKDDILDVEGNFEELGKSTGSDAKSEKSTYPSLLGLKESKELLKMELEEARACLRAVFPEEKIADFIELTEFMEKRKQ